MYVYYNHRHHQARGARWQPRCAKASYAPSIVLLLLFTSCLRSCLVPAAQTHGFPTRPRREVWSSSVVQEHGCDLEQHARILPARSGDILWMRGESLSPSICFCSCRGVQLPQSLSRAPGPEIITASAGERLRGHHLPNPLMTGGFLTVRGVTVVRALGLAGSSHLGHDGHTGPHHHRLARGRSRWGGLDLAWSGPPGRGSAGAACIAIRAGRCGADCRRPSGWARSGQEPLGPGMVGMKGVTARWATRPYRPICCILIPAMFAGGVLAGKVGLSVLPLVPGA